MVLGSCQICTDHSLLSDFRFFHCGHGFCRSCIYSFFQGSGRKTCPICRVPVTRQDARAIFFDTVDPKTSAVLAVVEGLSKMNKDSKLISVRKAENKVRKAVEDLEVNEDTASMLIRAVDLFKDRIIPTFTKIEVQAEEIASLRRDLQVAQLGKEHLDTEYRKARKAEMHLQKAKQSLVQALDERDKAISLAEQACQETVKLREAKEASARTLSELQEENELYRGQLQIHMKLERSRKDKISKLKNDVLVLRENLNLKEGENSLDIPTEPHIVYPSTQKVLMPMGSTSSFKSTPMCGAQRNSTRHDFEGMPSPSFASGWEIEASKSKKRKSSAISDGGKNNEFPLGLSRGGNPIKTVQLGPKRSLRAPLIGL